MAVIRVCGPRAVEVVSRSFHPPPGRAGRWPDPHRPERLCYGQWVIADETIDDVLVWAGTDAAGLAVVDINAHGSVRVVERILLDLEAGGVRLGEPDQASQHAWPAEHYLEAEALAALSRAKTRRAVDFLLHQREMLPRYLAGLAEEAAADPAKVCRSLRELLEGARGGQFLVDGATVAIIGPANAGKSTLANRLFGAPMAIVSPIPGTTRDWVAEPTAIRGIPVTLVDTPGLGSAPDRVRQEGDPIDELAVRRSRARWADADVKLLVLDGAAPLPAGFVAGVSEELSPEHLVVISKADLARRWEAAALPVAWRNRAVAVSAHSGEGIAALEERVVEQLSVGAGLEGRPALFTQRQARVVQGLATEPDLSAADLAQRIWADLLGRGANRGPGPEE